MEWHLLFKKKIYKQQEPQGNKKYQREKFKVTTNKVRVGQWE